MRTLILSALPFVAAMALSCGQVAPDAPEGQASGYELRYGKDHASILYRDKQRDLCLIFGFERSPSPVADFRVTAPHPFAGTAGIRCKGVEICGVTSSVDICERAVGADGSAEWRDPPITARGDVRMRFVNPRFGSSEERLQFNSAVVTEY